MCAPILLPCLRLGYCLMILRRHDHSGRMFPGARRSLAAISVAASAANWLMATWTVYPMARSSSGGACASQASLLDATVTMEARRIHSSTTTARGVARSLNTRQARIKWHQAFQHSSPLLRTRKFSRLVQLKSAKPCLSTTSSTVSPYPPRTCH